MTCGFLADLAAMWEVLRQTITSHFVEGLTTGATISKTKQSTVIPDTRDHQLTLTAKFLLKS